MQIHVFSRRDLGPHLSHFTNFYVKQLDFRTPFKSKRAPIGHQTRTIRSQMLQESYVPLLRGAYLEPIGAPEAAKTPKGFILNDLLLIMAQVFIAHETTLISFVVLPLNRQAPNLIQKTSKELANNLRTLVITNAHLQTVKGILQFPKQHQPQQTSRYEIRWRRCAHCMAHRDYTHVEYSDMCSFFFRLRYLRDALHAPHTVWSAEARQMPYRCSGPILI